jgi:hypothetical protein
MDSLPLHEGSEHLTGNSALFVVIVNLQLFVYPPTQEAESEATYEA